MVGHGIGGWANISGRFMAGHLVSHCRHGGQLHLHAHGRSGTAKQRQPQYEQKTDKFFHGATITQMAVSVLPALNSSRR